MFKLRGRMNLNDEAIALHKKLRGKLSVESKSKVKSEKELALLYTPGVAAVSLEIAKDKEKVYDYTIKGNTVAIVSDGTRVLGLGNIGAEAAMPVMEGKAILLKVFGNVDAFPICIRTQDKEEIIKFVKNIAPTFGAINMEDIQAPKCFEIVERLENELEIPVFHDDQHGTAIVVTAGLLNALKVVGKNLESAKIVIAGAGSGGYGISNLLYEFGARNILVTDSQGIIYQGREGDMNKFKKKLAAMTNPQKISGTLEDALRGADVLVGVSGKAGMVSTEMLKLMGKNAIVFALTNPAPEILPPEAKKAKNVAIVSTGRSDFPNQVNNSLVFPAVFRGVLDSGAKKITKEMRIAAAKALSESLPAKKLSKNYILPRMTDKTFFKKVAKAVENAAK